MGNTTSCPVDFLEPSRLKLGRAAGAAGLEQAEFLKALPAFFDSRNGGGFSIGDEQGRHDDPLLGFAPKVRRRMRRVCCTLWWF